MTTAPPYITVAYSDASSTTTTVCCSDHHGLTAAATTTDPKGHNDGCFGLATVLLQLPQPQISYKDYASYAMGPLQVSFHFQSWASHWCLHVGICYGVLFLLSGSNVVTIFTNGGLNHWDLHHCNLLEYIFVPPGAGLWPMLHCFEEGEPHATPTPALNHSISTLGHTALSHPVTLPSLCGGEGSSQLCSTQWHTQLKICGGN